MLKSKPLSTPTLVRVVKAIEEQDDESQVWGEWHAWNVAKGPAPNNAFAWRDQAAAHLEFQIHGSTDASKQAQYKAFFKGLEDTLRGATGGASYGGYADAGMKADPIQAYYGNNKCTLSRTKAKYDPNELFTNPLSITPNLKGC